MQVFNGFPKKQIPSGHRFAISCTDALLDTAIQIHMCEETGKNWQKVPSLDTKTIKTRKTV